MESEFSFKDLFFYCIKRWFIILIVAVVGMGSFLIYALASKTTKNDMFQAEVRFCSIDIFRENVPDTGSVIEQGTLLAWYSETSSSAMTAMKSNDVKVAFLSKPEVIENLKKIYYTKRQLEKLGNEPTFDKQFATDFSISSSATTFYITLNIDASADVVKENALEALNYYVAIAAEFAYKDNPVLSSYTLKGNPVEALTISQALTVPYTPEEEEKSLVSQIFTGLAIGLVVGIVITIIVYFVDPRIKSFSQLGGYAGVLLAKVKDSEIDKNAVLRAASIMSDAKIMMIATTDADGFADKFAKEFLTELTAADFKTLYINLSTENTGGEMNEGGAGSSFMEYIRSGKIEKSDGAFDVLNCKTLGEWVYVMPNKDKLSKLTETYDKIVISVSDNSQGAVKTVAEFSDKIVYVVCQKETRFKKLLNVIVDIGEAGKDKAVGTYIHTAL